MISTARIAEVNENTVASLTLQTRAVCEAFLRTRVRNIDITHLEVDEVRRFVKKKQERVKPTGPVIVGDAHCYIALRPQHQSFRCAVEDNARRPSLATELRALRLQRACESPRQGGHRNLAEFDCTVITLQGDRARPVLTPVAGHCGESINDTAVDRLDTVQDHGNLAANEPDVE